MLIWELAMAVTAIVTAKFNPHGCFWASADKILMDSKMALEVSSVSCSPLLIS